MKLTDLFMGLECALRVQGEADIQGLCFDSRKTQPGDLFFCQPGLNLDGHDFAQQAVDKGAAALVVSRQVPVDVPQVLVNDVREALSYASAAFYGNPASGMRLIGITGTKGKSTTAYLMKSILDQSGVKTGLIGTVSTMIGDRALPGTLTTPEPPDFQRTLRLMRDEGVQVLVMEVSANAMTFKRLAGLRFDVGVFTNFSQDHLDVYGTMDRYFDAKKQFMTPEYVKYGVINADDERAHQMAEGIPHRFFGIRDQSATYAADIDVMERGLSYTLCHENMVVPIRLGLSGLFNVYNSMAAAMACLHLGIGLQDVVAGLAAMTVVPGRIELLNTRTPYKVILDYAHTPDSLENILAAVRQFTKGRLIVLFGCGGNRDHEKRPIMGEISGKMADYTIITSDNPRSEEPMDIILQIEEGMKRTDGAYSVIEEREQAIYEGLKMARQDDTLVLAGKGHETYQEIKGVRRPFDEREVVARMLSRIAQEQPEGGSA